MKQTTNVIYYFSASGNSLASARSLARELGDTEVISITACAGSDMSPMKVRRIGFMFPVYGFGPPRILEEFLKTTRLPQADYHFAVASSGGTAAATTRILARLLRKQGRRLDAGYAVRDPYHSLDINRPPNKVIRFMMRLAGRQPENMNSFANRRDEMTRDILADRRRRLETTNLHANIAGRFLHPFSKIGFRRECEKFAQTETCTGCGTCVRICPRGNLSLENGRLHWGQNCEACLACVRWCPRLAISHAEMSSITATHHPDVNRRDFIGTRRAIQETETTHTGVR